METISDRRPHRLLGRWISIAIVAAAVVLGLAALYHANYYPRTEDAEVFANYIGIAPQVDGPVVRLNVKDNQFVRKGELLYEIDQRPYEYTLETSLSEQTALEGQISDERRKIACVGQCRFCCASKHTQCGSKRDKRRAGRQPGHARNGTTQTAICSALSRF